MTFIQRDHEIFESIKDGKTTELICIKEGYTDPYQGDSFRPGGEKHTLDESYELDLRHRCYIDTNFSFTIDIIDGSGVSLYFETTEVYKAMKRNDKIEELGIYE